MQLTIFDYLPQNERQSEICMQLFKPKRGPRMRAGYAAEAAKAISDRIQAEPIAVELEQVAVVAEINKSSCLFCCGEMRLTKIGFECEKDPSHKMFVSNKPLDPCGRKLHGEWHTLHPAYGRYRVSDDLPDWSKGKIVGLPVYQESVPFIYESTNSTPVSSPSVTAPEPAAKVVLGIPLKESHPGCGDIKPVCFYCKDQELEYVGLFPNAIKTMNHHIWRCKKQPRHQLVCAEKGDWWYQWCGGVGYGVTYGVPELWMWKDIFQAATGQEPELTLEPEIDECSELCQTIPCETCSELSLSIFDISSQKLTNRTVLLKSTELNELISETQKTSVCEISEELKKRGLYAPDFLIQAIIGGEPNTQALEAEAAELREKIAEVHEIRLRQKKVLELKSQREQIGKKISEVMGRGFSGTNDEEAAHFQKKYDRASEAIRALEEQIPTIIPATWRWEERLAEIEQQIEEKLK